MKNASHAPLTDHHGRRLSYLRISITDRCNFRCIYCNPHFRLNKLHHSEILKFEEILQLVQVGISLGINKVRITGGEPLVRKGVYDFLCRLTQIEGLEDVALTTNGSLLKDNINQLVSAGIRRINISLDTLNKNKFTAITGENMFADVIKGIELALDNGFSPVKLNMVVIKGINDDELMDMAGLIFTYPLHVRFIEYMPIGRDAMKSDHFFPAAGMFNRLQKLGKLMPVAKDNNDGPAERFTLPGAKGEIGIIGARTRHLCRTCNRLRMTASGSLRPCLLSDVVEDIKSPLRSGASAGDLRAIFARAARKKPFPHGISDSAAMHLPGEMIAIGG